MRGGDGNDVIDGDRVADFNDLAGDMVVFDAALGIYETALTISTTAAGTVISRAGESMTLTGYFGPIEPGNQMLFDYVPSMDFL